MIGIVGGLGPYAGTNLLNKIFDNTLASCDQEHVDAALISLPSKITDRTEYLNGSVKENPAIAIAKALLKLQTTGATVAGITCNTAHAKPIYKVIMSELEKAKSPIKVLSMIDETISFVSENYSNISNIGVLSTTGTYKSKVYYDALKSKGYKAIVPPPEMQDKIIHPAIYHPQYGIKAISKPIQKQARDNLLQGVSYLKEKGAQSVILGCTEISLAITEQKINGLITIDPTTILARALIQATNPNKLKPL